MELRADEEVRFARGRARTSPGCVVDHRRNDWASHSPHGEFEVVIMIEVVIEEMVGSDRVPDRKDYERAFDWKAQTISESEMALISECRQLCAQTVLDTADIVRDGDVSTVTQRVLSYSGDGTARPVHEMSSIVRWDKFISYNAFLGPTRRYQTELSTSGHYASI